MAISGRRDLMQKPIMKIEMISSVLCMQNKYFSIYNSKLIFILYSSAHNSPLLSRRLS